MDQDQESAPVERPDDACDERPADHVHKGYREQFLDVLAFAHDARRFVEAVRANVPSAHRDSSRPTRRADLPGFPDVLMRSASIAALNLAYHLVDDHRLDEKCSLWIPFGRGRDWMERLFWPLMEEWGWYEAIDAVATSDQKPTMSDTEVESYFPYLDHLIFKGLGGQSICPAVLSAFDEALSLIKESCLDGWATIGVAPDQIDVLEMEPDFLGWLGKSESGRVPQESTIPASPAPSSMPGRTAGKGTKVPVPQRTRRLKGEAATLVDAALDSLAARGEWGATDREIIKRAGVAVSTFYRLIRSDRIERKLNKYRGNNRGRGPARPEDF